ncbi:V Activated protein C cofactor Coagulation factor [Triplophysa tibetana]|uniref:ferroxidase n=1 Tax=Triplophysa tibetana TaxID=1572043 RepID=A0A5A9P4L2_9TELE|nr:V Activated protein C cofactor Coagulation factor [Triplophysa tibetana]
MQLCFWPGAPYGLALLAFLSHCVTAVERRYHIAAINVDWDYTSDVQKGAIPTYRKIVYREYDAGFTKAKAQPLSSGLLGPTLRGQEGDTIIVTFRNMADRPCSIHPHGIAYGKQSEGASYFDNTSLNEKEDDVILPGKEHTYYWEVTSEVAPLSADPPCITYTYLSHVDIVKDFNTGLIGTMLICKKGALDDSGNQTHFHQEAVLLFAVFDENKSWYSTGGPPQARNVKYTINGYTNGSVPAAYVSDSFLCSSDIGICAHSKVSWHLLAMSSEPELFSVHFNGQVLLQHGHKTSAIGIISGTATSASMNAVHPGRWLFSSYISKHLEAGLHGYLNIRTCEEFPAPKRRLTIQEREESKEWTYFIAAEEIIWDYAPNMPENMDGDFRMKYLKQGSHRIGKKYKKAVFTQYKDGTFKERSEDKQRKKELGILGPVIRAQIRDVIKIVFKNKASRPYSIYPHGLTIDKSAEGASYPEGGNQTHGIQPGETYTYVWNVGEEDVPTDSDSRCLTRMYHSAVDTPRDIASGLVGPLLICKSQSLDKKNVQLKADKEQHAMFSVFDENKSWYFEENINNYTNDPTKVKREDPEFYQSNVMHTINGYVYESGQELGFCLGEIVTWHVSSVGEQDYIQSATFYGHTFELKNREEDMLALFPMTGATISMNMGNIGIWLLASMNSHDSNKGMRVKFKDLECFRDYFTEHDFEELDEYTAFKLQPINEIFKETAKPTNPNVVDEDTNYFAELLGMRSFRNQNSAVNSSIHETTKKTANSINPNVDDEETEYFADLLGLRKLKNQDVEPLLDHDDGFFPTAKEKSHNATSATSNQTVTHHLSVYLAGLDKKHISNQSITNESTADASQNMTSSFDSESEIMASNGTDSIKKHFQVKQNIATNATYLPPIVRNASIAISSFSLYENGDGGSLEMVSETDSVFTNTTHLPNNLNNASFAISSFSLYENVSLEMVTETNSVSTNTTHLPNNLNNASLAISSFSLYENVSLEMVTETNSVSTNTNHLPNNLNNASLAISSFSLNENVSLEMVTETNSVSTNTNHLPNNLNNASLAISSFSLYENVSLEMVTETNSVSTNTNHLPNNLNNASLAISSFSLYENVSLEMVTETDSVSTNTTHLPNNQRNITLVEPMNETHSVSLNTSDGKRNITIEDGGRSLDSTEEKLLNQSSEHFKLNKTDVNSTDIADVNSDASGHIFTYNVPSSDSLSIASEPAEYFLLLDNQQTLEKYMDDMSPTFQKNTTLELFENTVDPTPITKGIEELRSTRENDSSKVYSLVNSEIESAFSTPYLNVSMPSRDSLVRPNTTSSKIHEMLESTSEILNNASLLFHVDNMNISVNVSSTNSSESITEDSFEEVVIYLKNNHSEAFLSSPLNPEEEHMQLNQNWGYESTHKLVPMEIPDHIKKYITDEPAAKNNEVQSPKKKKKVFHMPVKPRKGHAMKTKKRKEYKPQALSEMSSLGQSPRGFGPAVFSPRGTRPVSSEEDLMNKPVVIGVPRRDFNDYDLYVPKQEQEKEIRFPDKTEDYEFVEYKDPYSKSVNFQNTLFDTTSQHFLTKAEDKDTRTYYIAAEEKEWDYAGYGHRRLDKSNLYERPMAFKKVVFRKYLDITFSIRDIRGEMDEHLGILGPVIKAEVDQTIMIIFRNRASRPYSLHANGVTYLKQMEGLSYDDQSPYWYKLDDAVQPNSSFVYMWTINPKSGPQNHESDCRTWTYYSGVNPERDINSGLIGPLLICRKGTLVKPAMDRREFVLLFMTFNENKSWYYEENRARIERKNKRTALDPNFHDNLKFDAINGIIYSLKGLRMYTNQVAKWHLINMGSPKDLHSVHFHGQTFINKELRDHRQGVYPLLPGGFATLEMLPSKPGLWQLESEVGLSQERGMQTLFLVLDNVCDHPLGLISGTVKDEQITASDHRAQTKRCGSSIRETAMLSERQVDILVPLYVECTFQHMPALIWLFYVQKTFEGNNAAHVEKENIFFPPLIGRYVRLHPLQSYNSPTVRMEYFGCELDGCSLPIGMQSGIIEDHQITASSVALSWRSEPWHPWYARLNKQGTINAWQAKNNDMQQWIQVTLPVVKKITGIITQGAKSFRTEMFVKEFILEYSDDGMRWTKYTDDNDYEQKTFKGNTNNNGLVKNYIFPPIFSRFIRVVPKLWKSCITMRIELLGCDFE